MAPGGIAEMTITAGAAFRRVPLVTVFHVCRHGVRVRARGLYRLLLRRMRTSKPA